MNYRYYWSLICDQANQKAAYYGKMLQRYKRSQNPISRQAIIMEIGRYQQIAIFSMKRIIKTY